jgi:hypothetical protein
MKLLKRPVLPPWPDTGNHSSARPLLYASWVGFHCEPLRSAIRAFHAAGATFNHSGLARNASRLR